LIETLIFEYVDSDLPAQLRLCTLLKVVSFDSSSAFHGVEETGDKIPGLGKLLVFDGDVKFPIRCSVVKLVLGVPINSTIWGVKLDKPIIAQCLIIFTLTYLVSILNKILISEFKWKIKLVNF
jgi:hypothetical protein